MEYIFSSYKDFLNEYQNYRFDECSVCHSICELEERLIGGRTYNTEIKK